MRACLFCGTLVALLAAAGCKGPAAGFTADPRYGKPPLEVQFTDTSNPNGSPITAWLWTFGDGESSTEQHPVHTYTEEGSYTVSLTVTNADGEDMVRGSGYIVAGNMWAEAYGTAGDDYALAICTTNAMEESEEGEGEEYVIAGTTPDTQGNMDMYVLRVDVEGNQVWAKTFGGTGDEAGEAIVAVPADDKGDEEDIVIAGWTTSFGKGSSDVYVLRLDKEGKEIWSETYGGMGADRGYAMAATSDGGFIITGESNSNFSDKMDLYLLKITGDGTEEWAKTFTGPPGPGLSDESGSAVLALSDGYLAAGYSDNGNEQMYIVRTTNDGTKSWETYIGGLYDDRAYALASAGDSGFIVAGKYNPGQFTSVDLTAVKLDNNGKQVWLRTFGGNRMDTAYAILAKSTSEFIIGGVTASTENNDENVYLVKIDGQGEALWTRNIGGAGDDAAYALVQASDGGFLLAGETNSLGAGQKDVYLLRCNSSGYAPSSPQP
ncbi:MAG TPA: PKD domain-containing protein [Candidatus Hydrogenedentes bacterium]|nr:PKD domain-containing protein [Candidatus Hydrogenedentota bacterium]